MSYILDKNPAGKTPGVGWRTNMRGLGSYRRSTNPTGRRPGDLRGLGCSGNCGGCAKKLGCARLNGLGQDDSLYTGLNPDGTVDTSWETSFVPVQIPAGSGYGPAESGGVATYPAGAGNVGPYATPGNLSTSSVVASSLPAIFGTGITTTAPASSSSEWLWIIGGVGALAVVLSLGKRR